MTRRTKSITALGAAVVFSAAALFFLHAPMPKAAEATLDLGVADVQSNQPSVALTFDDGPDPRFTPKILAELRSQGVPATFFVLGPSAEKHPGLIWAEAVAGDEVACHGWKHRSMIDASADAVVASFDRCAAQVRKILGKKPHLVRPPYGVLSPQGAEALETAGFQVIYWDIGLTKWRATDPAKAGALLAARAHPGDIILLHDGRLDRTDVIEALPNLINGLRRRGLRFTTVTQLISQGKTKPETWSQVIGRYCHYTWLRRPGISTSSCIHHSVI
jgi:peptidoglycan/xylan/chitin deacetylase (PgdA/CDA1 family)